MKRVGVVWRAIAFGAVSVLCQNGFAATPHRPQAFPTKEPQYSQQKSALSNIALESAWDVTQGDRSVIVAIIDDAFDIDHPDLLANMLPGKNFFDYGNTSNPRPTLSGCSGGVEDHGTSVAGVIGAVGDNATGIAGINWHVGLLPLKVGCSYGANPEAQALAEALRRGASVINMSYGGISTSVDGGRQWSPSQVSALAAANVLLVAAAGNYDGNNDLVPFFPANEPLPNLLSVAAVDSNNKLMPWSHYGQTTVALAAPGSGLYTTLYDPARSTNYGYVSGTSFAAPVVSGIAALIKAAYPNATARDLRGALLASVTPLGSGVTAKLMTDGVVNARGALDAMKAPVSVLLVRGVSIADGANGNGVLDPRETATLSLTLENAWAFAPAVTATLKTTDAVVAIPTPQVTLGAFASGETKKVAFQITLSDFVGHHVFPFALELNDGSGRVVTRSFVVESGPLKSGQLFQATIQKDDFDEAHFYHLNIPANPNFYSSKPDSVVFEVDYTLTTERDIDLIAAANKRPLVGLADFSLSSDACIDPSVSSCSANKAVGFERAEFPVTGQAMTAHAMVVNVPEHDSQKEYTFNKPYTIRACYLNQNDGGHPPVANAGADVTVEAGAIVKLSASASDPDAGGRIVSRWWTPSAGAPKLTNYKIDEPTFTAPESGTFTFSFSVSDDTCRVGTDSVTVTVHQAADAVVGLALYPSSATVEAGGYLSQVVQGSINSISIGSLAVDSKPLGVNFDSSTGQLTWQNVNVPGKYVVTFAAADSKSNARYTAKFTITVVDRAASGNAQGVSSGGCTVGTGDEFDPSLPLLIVASFFFLRRTTVLKRRN